MDGKTLTEPYGPALARALQEHLQDSYLVIRNVLVSQKLVGIEMTDEQADQIAMEIVRRLRLDQFATEIVNAVRTHVKTS